eukprot:TRINITY_DN63480_c0_g1_i1.p1 TRINITY_DN63480_c0_g1~~TRINITY_DN63480_c0_g1_i1.p1  ORF type:complete len:343 (+),score=71.93 TRINITY_DN63480_c0_g1_i1:65-1093(+)
MLRVPMHLIRTGRSFCSNAHAVNGLFSPIESLPSVTAQLAASSPCEDAHRTVPLSDGSILFGMLDGHAGTHAVLFAQRTLIAQAVMRLEARENVLGDTRPAPVELHTKFAEAMVDAFEATDQMFADQVRKAGRPPKVTRTGACAMLVHVSADHKMLHVANAGDCRCVLARVGDNGEMEAVALSQDHNAMTNPHEARLLAAKHPGEGKLLTRGYVKGRVQMTRSIGDLYLKYEEFNTKSLGKTQVQQPYHPPYLSCMPEMTAHTIQPSDRFLVIATDGLWSELENHEVISIAQRAMTKGDCPARELAAKALNEAAPVSYTHLRAHETPEHLVCRLLLEKKKKH